MKKESRLLTDEEIGILKAQILACNCPCGFAIHSIPSGALIDFVQITDKEQDIKSVKAVIEEIEKLDKLGQGDKKPFGEYLTPEEADSDPKDTYLVISWDKWQALKSGIG